MCGENQINIGVYSGMFIVFNVTVGRRRHNVMKVKIVEFSYAMYITFMQDFIVQEIAVTLQLPTQLEHNSSLHPKICTNLTVT